MNIKGLVPRLCSLLCR